MKANSSLFIGLYFVSAVLLFAGLAACGGGSSDPPAPGAKCSYCDAGKPCNEGLYCATLTITGGPAQGFRAQRCVVDRDTTCGF